MDTNVEVEKIAESLVDDAEKMASAMADEETFEVSPDDPDVEVLDDSPVEETPAHAASPDPEEDPSNG